MLKALFPLTFMLKSTIAASLLTLAVIPMANIANAKIPIIKKTLDRDTSCQYQTTSIVKQFKPTNGNTISATEIKELCLFINEEYKKRNAAPKSIRTCTNFEEHINYAEFIPFAEANKIIITRFYPAKSPTDSGSVNLEIMETRRWYKGVCKKGLDNANINSRHTNQEKMDAYDWVLDQRLRSKPYNTKIYFNIYKFNGKWHFVPDNLPNYT